MAYISGTKDNPMVLKTPPLTSEFTIHIGEKDGEEILVCTVGKTVLHYNIRCLDDLHAKLSSHNDWMDLGSADEQKPAKDGTFETWGRSEHNPVSGWYGLKKRASWTVRNVYSSFNGKTCTCRSDTRSKRE